MASLLPNPKQFYALPSGLPNVGGKVFTYDAGTSNPRATYTDAAGGTPNANPVILDARGEADIFWSGSYKVTLTDSTGAVIWTRDNISGGVSGAITASGFTMSTAKLLGRSTAATGAIEEISPGATLLLAAGSLGVASVPSSVTFNATGGAAAGSSFNGSAARVVDYSTVGASPARPTFPGNVSASFSATDADNNTDKIFSGAAQTLTLGNLTAGTAFTGRFTTAWSLAVAGGLSKNGAAPAAVTTGSIAANSVITFFHEGAGVWRALGSGLT
jgi:hypothetical protein